jgi:hypothetical protein
LPGLKTFFSIPEESTEKSQFTSLAILDESADFISKEGSNLVPQNSFPCLNKKSVSDGKLTAFC